jgi:hypothetical protein
MHPKFLFFFGLSSILKILELSKVIRIHTSDQCVLLHGNGDSVKCCEHENTGIYMETVFQNQESSKLPASLGEIRSPGAAGSCLLGWAGSTAPRAFSLA